MNFCYYSSCWGICQQNPQFRLLQPHWQSLVSWQPLSTTVAVTMVTPEITNTSNIKISCQPQQVPLQLSKITSIGIGHASTAVMNISQAIPRISQAIPRIRQAIPHICQAIPHICQSYSTYLSSYSTYLSSYFTYLSSYSTYVKLFHISVKLFHISVKLFHISVMLFLTSASRFTHLPSFSTHLTTYSTHDCQAIPHIYRTVTCLPWTNHLTTGQSVVSRSCILTIQLPSRCFSRFRAVTKPSLQCWHSFWDLSRWIWDFMCRLRSDWVTPL